MCMCMCGCGCVWVHGGMGACVYEMHTVHVLVPAVWANLDTHKNVCVLGQSLSFGQREGGVFLNGANEACAMVSEV